jgi:hypothetical protein
MLRLSLSTTVIEKKVAQRANAFVKEEEEEEVEVEVVVVVEEEEQEMSKPFTHHYTLRRPPFKT